ncbi:MAG: bifunctional demethylmenaquinone methyltransferase/2-methoxy-6-polyprenyl-1,4-benzoquinol methylase UbiE [Oligoflexia bacterium]|nr:bifunctional demethylmenaquinone methyltransferase/2-methoxy-6-polyprenyl-1,4-benzoquinol methylase UbiE [Oligoflexia bacterium]
MKASLTKRSPQEIKKIFNSIALNYDRANKAITLGMDSWWRKKLVKWSEAPLDGKILDCATGTGVLAFEFQKQLGPKAQITAVDFCEGMLKQAYNKVNSSSISPKNIDFQTADVQELPFQDNKYDVCAMAYGLRNVEDPIKTLMEMARITKKGGTVMILETGDRPMFLLYPLFYLYFRFIVPRIGGWLTGQKSAYEYLQKSSQNFPSRHSLLTLMDKTKCFSECQYKTLFFGSSFIYKARVSKEH